MKKYDKGISKAKTANEVKKRFVYRIFIILIIGVPIAADIFEPTTCLDEQADFYLNKNNEYEQVRANRSETFIR